VFDAGGKLLEENVPQGREAISPELAYVITHMLRGVVERGTGQAARSLGRPVAAKTGSTNDYSNAWFLGYTPRLVSGVWIGYDRPRSLGREETGGRLAGPIWTSYMARILGDSPREEFPVPERVAIVSVDRDPSNECIRPVPLAFVRGTEPAASCGPRRQMTPSGASGSPSEPGAQPVEPSPESGPPAAPRAAEPGPSAGAARAAEPGPSAATPRTHEPGPPAAAPRALAPTPPPAAGSSGDRRSAAPGQQAP
jgi:penicillin-binding protein 1A